LKTALLLGALSGLLLVIGQLLGGANGMLLGFIFAVVMNFGSYWFSDKIVLKMYRAQEVAAGHRLYGMVERLSRNAQLPMPKVYIIPDPSPNAFATGRNPSHAAVAATEGILQILNDHELEGVIAHELAHVKHRDILISSVAATIAAAIMFAASAARWGMMLGGYGGNSDRDRGTNPLALLVTVIVAPIAAMLIQMAISRSREFSADAGGAQIAGNPYGLADALRKMESVVKRVPLDANPATAHMFIMKPFSDAGLASQRIPRDLRAGRVCGKLARSRDRRLIGFIFAVVMNLGSYWFSDKIVLRMFRAQEVGTGTGCIPRWNVSRGRPACRCRRSTSFRIRRRTRSRPVGTPRTPPSRPPTGCGPRTCRAASRRRLSCSSAG